MNVFNNIKYNLSKLFFLFRYFNKIKKYYPSWNTIPEKLQDEEKTRKKLFQSFVADSVNQACLQIGVRDQKHAPHWVSCDLYDTRPLIDYNDDIHNLKFEKHSFDKIACLAILEHVENPLQAIGELKRVLKPHGEIWVEVPFSQPYHPSPNDYWRVTLQGLRLWLKDFHEIKAGYFGNPLYNGIFFFGKKKE